MSIKNKLLQMFHSDAKKGRRISPTDAAKALQDDEAVLVDVREEGELRESGLAEKALWIPTSEIEARTPFSFDFEKSLSKEKVIIVYCAAGVRAGRYAQYLSEQGFETANLGGFSDWAKAGLPVKGFGKK